MRFSSPVFPMQHLKSSPEERTRGVVPLRTQFRTWEIVVLTRMKILGLMAILGVAPLQAEAIKLDPAGKTRQMPKFCARSKTSGSSCIVSTSSR